jgi:hypothetical protein
MKTILKNCLFLIYCIVSCFILGCGILFPFAAGMEKNPISGYWGFILYPIVIFIASSSEVCIKYFTKDI